MGDLLELLQVPQGKEAILFNLVQVPRMETLMKMKSIMIITMLVPSQKELDIALTNVLD
jgi:hypothetical protein